MKTKKKPGTEGLSGERGRRGERKEGRKEGGEVRMSSVEEDN